MRLDHIFHRVRDQLAAGQAVQHAVMAHGDTVIHSDGVEFLGVGAGGLNLAGDHLAKIFQVHMPRHELCKRVRDRDDRLVHILFLGSGGAPQ